MTSFSGQSKGIRSVTGPAFDCVGDLHGEMDLLVALLERMGYVLDIATDGHIARAQHPEGRLLLFVGDYVNRGPRPLAVLRSIFAMTQKGPHAGVVGNHEEFLKSWLLGAAVGVRYPGMDTTRADLSQLSRQELVDLVPALRAMPYEILAYDESGSLVIVVSHAGIRRQDVGVASREVLGSLIFGRTSEQMVPLLKNMDPGSPDSGSWVADWAFTKEGAFSVSGHLPLERVLFRGRLVMLDTGAGYPWGKLSAFRYPQEEIVSVRAPGA